MWSEALAVFAAWFLMMSVMWGPALVWWLWPDDRSLDKWLAELRKHGR